MSVKDTIINKLILWPWRKAIMEIIFDHENRIRALEGKQPITKQQAINAVRAKMDD